MNKIIQEITKICQNCININKVVLFGSRARGTHQSTSDFDLALYLNPETPAKTKTNLLYLLDEIDCLQKIDVLFVTKKTNQRLLENIEKEGVVLMEHNSKKENFMCAVKRLEEAVKLCEENPCDFYFMH